MSTPTFEQIRDQQKEVWNKFSPGWKKWDEFTMAFLRLMGDEIIAALKLFRPRRYPGHRHPAPANPG